MHTINDIKDLVEDLKEFKYNVLHSEDALSSRALQGRDIVCLGLFGGLFEVNINVGEA